MLLSLIAAALQPELPAPPAPPSPAIVPAPPVINVPPLVRTNLNRPVVTFSVRVTLGNEQLVEERLRVGQTGAVISRTRSEALAGNCPGQLNQLSQNMNVSLRPDWSSENLDRYQVEARISRPNQQGCDGGSRGVSLNQQFSLARGQSVSFSGDGGLRIELRRD